MSLIGKLKYRKPVPIGESRAKRGHSSSITHKHSTHKRSDTNQSPAERLDEKIFTRDLEENLAIFENLFGMNMDLLIRRFQIQIQSSRIHCAIIYLDSSSSKADINEILRALMFDIDQSDQTGLPVWDMVMSQCIPYADVTVKKTPSDATDWLLSGNSLLFLDGWDEVIGLSTQAFKERGIKEPATEQVIQGPRDGFIESIGTNISLLRKRMRSANLRIKLIQLGREATTNIAYCYCEGIVNKDLVNEVEKRLRLVDTDAIYGAGFLEQYIEDNHYSPFPQVQNTERPDKAVAAMLEGRVVILVDGTPFALIVPAVFTQFYQTSEDYDTRFLMASMIRGIRVVALLFSLIFPSLYISLISFNPEMIPTKFEVAVAGGRAGIPFPAVAEIFGLEVIMEVLREATIRLPQQIGGALSIVGVLVVGEAAVRAGFVSPIAVVIVALTTIGSFATPAYNAAIALRMLRFPLMILAGMFGLYGVMVGIILISNHLNKLESFGIPYLSPVVPVDPDGLKDALIRMPVWSMKSRPKQLQPEDQNRVDENPGAFMDPKGRPLAPADHPSSGNTSSSSGNSSPSPDNTSSSSSNTSQSSGDSRSSAGDKQKSKQKKPSPRDSK